MGRVIDGVVDDESAAGNSFMSISELSFLKAQGQGLTGARVVRELT